MCDRRHFCDRPRCTDVCARDELSPHVSAQSSRLDELFPLRQDSTPLCIAPKLHQTFLEMATTGMRINHSRTGKFRTRGRFMRFIFTVPTMCLILSSAAPAFAETAPFNHLDCNFNEEKQELICPDILDGRSAAGPVVPVPAAPVPATTAVTPGQGSPEWNAECAAKYKSFDASTGMYKSFSGQMRPCR